MAIANQRSPAYTYEQLKIALLSEEDRLNQEGNVDNVMAVNTKYKKIFCHICGKHGSHYPSQCQKSKKTSNRSKYQNHREKYCTYHRTRGHDTQECKSIQQETNQVEDQYNKGYHFHVTDGINTTDNTSISATETVMNVQDESDFLLVDSGCTTHIETQEKNMSMKSESADKHFIQLANGEKHEIVQGIGNVSMTITDTEGSSHSVTVDDALYIPSFKKGILSVSKLVRSGHSVLFSPEGNFITTHDGKRFNLVHKNNLYYLQRNQASAHSVSSVSSNQRTLQDWHTAMGHCNQRDLLSLEQHVKGMTITDKKPFDCPTCPQGKMTNDRSRIAEPKASVALELIYCDVIGPITPTPKSGYRYGMSFVDSHSGLIKVHLMRLKSEVTQCLKRYISDMAPYGKIKRLRCDNALEFKSKDFKQILLDNHIKQEFSSPYSPHQNAVAERSHRTILDMTRCLLLESGLNKTFWPYALKTAVYIRNRCYNPRLGKTPFETITGQQPNLSTMRVFGSKCFVYEHRKTKLDPRSVPGIFVGYDFDSASYMVYLPNKGGVLKVRRENVKFQSNSPPQSTLSIASRAPSTPTPMSTPLQPSTTTSSPESATQAPSAPADAAVQTPIEQGNSSPPAVKASQTTATQTPPVARQSIFAERYPERERHRPTKFNDYVSVAHETFIHHVNRVEKVPVTYQQAIKSVDASRWREAMDEEMAALEENETFELSTLPEGRTAVGGRWVYQIKPNPNGNEKYKARFVAKGYSQVPELDYNETFAPTAKIDTLRILINLAVQNNWVINQMDVKTAFLNAEIDTEIFVHQPEGYVQLDDQGKPYFLKLKKGLYGLKQSSRLWNSKIHKFFISEGFVQSMSDPCLYIKRTDNDILIVLIWVDDIIMISSNESKLNDLKKSFKSEFKMTDLGLLTWFIGMQFIRSESSIEINQTLYVEKILKRFEMSDCHPCKIPIDPSFVNLSTVDSPELSIEETKLYREIVGSLIYVMTGTRPDLSFVVSKLAQYMSKPLQVHLNAARHVLKYLKGTSHFCLKFSKVDSINLIGFCDSDWGASEDRKSYSGFCFMLNSSGPLISWKTRKQQTVALSSCEAEYMSITDAIQHGLFLKQLLYDLLNVELSINLGVDNQGAINLAKNPVNHQRSKHIDIKFHFIRDEIQKGIVTLFYVHTNDNISDMFTKPITQRKIKQFDVIWG